MKISDDRIKLIDKFSVEAKEFAKDVRKCLFEIEKERPLTDAEKTLWEMTHNVHVHMEDVILMVRGQQ